MKITTVATMTEAEAETEAEAGVVKNMTGTAVEQIKAVEQIPEEAILLFGKGVELGWDTIGLLWRMYSTGLPMRVPELDISQWPVTDRGEKGFGSTGVK